MSRCARMRSGTSAQPIDWIEGPSDGEQARLDLLTMRIIEAVFARELHPVRHRLLTRPNQ